jgi:hypothetical protein
LKHLTLQIRDEMFHWDSVDRIQRKSCLVQYRIFLVDKECNSPHRLHCVSSSNFRLDTVYSDQMWCP